MRAFICFLLCFSFLSAPIHASDKAVSLDSVCSGLTEFKVTSGSFVQSRQAPGLKRPLKSSGSFVICDKGIAWKTLKPISSVLAVSRDKIIQTTPDGRKNVIDGSGNQTFKNIAETLATVFSGDRSALEKNFRVSFSSDGNSWTINLVPKDSTIASAIKAIDMAGTSGYESFIDSVSIQEKDGAYIEYSFSEQVHGNSLSNDEKAYFSVE